MENINEIHEILARQEGEARNVAEEVEKFCKELKETKKVISVVEKLIYTCNSFSEAAKENAAEIQERLTELLEETEGERMMQKAEAIDAQSIRLEIASILDDLVSCIPDVLLRENLEILARILRDETEEIKNHFIYPRLVKKFA